MKKIPLRQCIGCGEMKSKKEMIRVLKTTEDEIVIDATGRKNGRGAYICPSMECFKKAVKSKGLERSLKMAIPKEVYEALEKEMGRLDSSKKGAEPLGNCNQGRQDGQRRIYDREGCERGPGFSGPGIRGGLCQYEKSVYQYVYLL